MLVADGTGAVNWETPLDDAAGYSVAITDDEEYVAVGAAHYNDSADFVGTPGIHLYDGNGVELWTYDHREDVLSVGIDTDRELVVGGTDDGRTIALNFDGDVVWETDAFGGWVVLSADGGTVLSSEPDRLLARSLTEALLQRWERRCVSCPFTEYLNTSVASPLVVSAAEGMPAQNTVTEIEFRVSDTRYPLTAISAETGCTAELVQLLPRSDGRYIAFFRFSGAPVEDILDFDPATEAIDTRVISESSDELLVELHLETSEELFSVTLIDAGAIPRTVRSADGVAYIVAEIPATHNVRDVVEHFQTVYPEMDLVAQRQKAYSMPLFRQEDIHNVIKEVLTPRQHEVLVTAYAGGYYKWPREKTAEELAAELEVSPATFSQHIRIAERKLLELLFQ